MTITRSRQRHGIIVQDVGITDLSGDVATALAEWDTVDPGAAALLQGYIDAAQRIMETTPKTNKAGTDYMMRWKAAKATIRHAREAINYLRDGDAEHAVYNALIAAHYAWIMDVKGVEHEIVKGSQSIRTHKKAAATTNEKVQAANKARDARIADRARKIIAAGTATKSRVSQYLVDESLAAGLRVDAVRDILRKAGIR